VRKLERRSSFFMAAIVVLVSSAFSFYAGAAGLFPQLLKPLAALPQLIQPNRQPLAGLGLDLKRLQQAQGYIQERFVDEVSTEKLMEGALKGMFEATGDKYSAYYNADEFASFLGDLEPTFHGIGVYVETSAKTGLVTVTAPIKGSPGEKAGLRAGDAIVAVDGKDITKLSLEQAIKLIRGPSGSKVGLSIRRDELPDPFQVSVTRAEIEVPIVETKMVDSQAGVGYIRLLQFKKDSTARLRAAISELQGQGMTRMILDLRQNPGGLLDEAIGVSSLFVPGKEPVVHIVHRGGKKDTFESKAKSDFNTPLVVLVDAGSASASEIVAGAIKDLNAGVLMGVTTFGKGSVQSFFDLPDGGGVKLTTARYLTAGGHSINGIGVVPDIEVENPTKVLPGAEGDVQLQQAIKHIKTLN
jgi:carboxyl-terminal processing protease